MMFRNYEYFVAIAEAGSLTRAAEILYVSQPSLSQYLRLSLIHIWQSSWEYSLLPAQFQMHWIFRQ